MKIALGYPGAIFLRGQNYFFRFYAMYRMKSSKKELWRGVRYGKKMLNMR